MILSTPYSAGLNTAFVCSRFFEKLVNTFVFDKLSWECSFECKIKLQLVSFVPNSVQEILIEINCRSKRRHLKSFFCGILSADSGFH